MVIGASCGLTRSQPIKYYASGSPNKSADNVVFWKLEFIFADKFNLIYMVFFSLGLSTLLPWNFFISLNGFWDYKFRNTTALNPYLNLIHIPTEDEHSTPLQQQFTSYLAIASNIPNAAFVILNALYGQKFSLNQRVSFALTGINILFIAVTVLAGTTSLLDIPWRIGEIFDRA